MITIPDRPEFDGTVAHRIASLLLPAAFALWALRFERDGEAAWAECPRPDWLVDTVMKTDKFAAGDERHRRLVSLLVDTARCELARFEPPLESMSEYHDGLQLLELWARRAVSASSLIDPGQRFYAASDRKLQELARAGRDTPEEAEAMRTYAIRVAVSFTMMGATSPTAVVGATLAFALVQTGTHASPELADAVRASFPCPRELVSP